MATKSGYHFKNFPFYAVPDLDLLIVGKIGSGKSSTGNSILGGEIFDIAHNSERRTRQCYLGKASVDGRTVTVLDTPGLCNSGMDGDTPQTEIPYAFHHDLSKWYTYNDGFHAIVIVLRFGDMVTMEELTVIQELKQMFGDDALRGNGVVVVTGADNFVSTTDGAMTLEEWSQICDPNMGIILEECQNRFVLFDNSSNDENLLKYQISELIKLADALCFRRLQYRSTVSLDIGAQSEECSTHLGRDLHLLFVGKAGSGKSSAGNSILGGKIFDIAHDYERGTLRCDLAKTFVDGRTVTVLDTPGLCNPGMDDDTPQTEISEAFHDGLIKWCNDGFHAIIIVLRFGDMVTMEELTVIQELKQMFGDDALRGNGVVVVTGADNFVSTTDGAMTLEEWGKMCDPNMGIILEECQNRFVLFDNLSNDEDVLKYQKSALIKLVDVSCSKCLQYSRPVSIDDERPREDLSLPYGSDLDLLIVGKTGNGKSSTGNSLLENDFFKTSDSLESETTTCGVGRRCIDGRTITACDTPGLCDTRMEESASHQQALKAFTDCLNMFHQGFHAILIVLKVCSKMTKEELQAIRLVEEMLGGNVLHDHAVIVFTGGDHFKATTRGRVTFEEWCQEQTGTTGEIFERCGYRCVLFDNSTEDKEVLQRQRKELVQIIDGLQSRGMRYTSAMFHAIQQKWHKAEDKGKKPDVAKEVYLRMSQIGAELNRIVRTNKYDKTMVAELRKELTRIECLNSQLDDDARIQMSQQIRDYRAALDELNKSGIGTFFKETVLPVAKKALPFVVSTVVGAVFPASRVVTLAAQGARLCRLM